jgi:hypothetical protein
MCGNHQQKTTSMTNFEKLIIPAIVEMAYHQIALLAKWAE